MQKGATKANATDATTTKAETSIATAAENAISTLDVYVFGAESENGDYTFLERFAYRADSNDKLPKDAKELQPNTTGADGKETTALIKLKKGLFVKLYCIANDTTLVDPTTDKEVKPKDFTLITFTENEDGTPQLATEGKPLESTFVTWHTRLLTATAKADTLVTPLAMAGAYTTPIDLTSFDNSARIQVGFKLTRLAARFDIDNKAGDSRFTIETVSMGNGRRGSGFFPIRVYGDLPKAKPDQLITYPVHAFFGENANNGLQTGAFYAYPNPKDDKAYMILKGKYKVNETEMKDVSYQIPFMQQGANGNATWFDIANNHRYTIAITRGLNLEQRIYQFSVGASNKNIMLMIWISSWRGFAQSAQPWGAIMATGKPDLAAASGQSAAGGNLFGIVLHFSFHRYVGRYHCRTGSCSCRYRGQDGCQRGFHDGGSSGWCLFSATTCPSFPIRPSRLPVRKGA